jgi:hypothetical protein
VGPAGLCRGEVLSAFLLGKKDPWRRALTVGHQGQIRFQEAIWYNLNLHKIQKRGDEVKIQITPMNSHGIGDRCRKVVTLTTCPWVNLQGESEGLYGKD